MRLKPEYHQLIYFFGLLLIAVALPTSRFLMSVGQFVLIINWLWEGNYIEKLKRFWSNKAAVLLCSLFLLHIVGMLYTNDYDYALNDIRVKLPLLGLPVIISSSPLLSAQRFKWLMQVFIASVIITTGISMLVLLGFTGKEVDDTRQISLFISHIRFSLLICVAIFSLAYFAAKNTNGYLKAGQIMLIAWLIVFLFIFESVTGVVVLAIVTFAIMTYYAIRQRKIILRIASLAALLLIILLPTVYVYHHVSQFFDVDETALTNPETYSAGGEEYRHFSESEQLENGNYVWMYIASKELETTWNKRSELDFHGSDLLGQSLSATLIRFLASKGLRKDALAVSSLSDEEIDAVENGIANVKFINGSNFNTRMYQIIWELHNYSIGNNPEGNSVTQRLEFWKAALGIIKENPVFGVGTGDVKLAFEQQYEAMNTQLSAAYRLKAHNQYLSMLVAFGIVGFLLFIAMLVYPFFMPGRFYNFLYITFFMVAALSMLSEDTLGTQAGVTFFTFFYCLLVAHRSD